MGEAALFDAWVLGTVRLWVCFGCLPWAGGWWWGGALGASLAWLMAASGPAPVLDVWSVVGEVFLGAGLGLCARMLADAGMVIGGMLRHKERVRLWFWALLVAGEGHIVLMEAAALSLRWHPVGVPLGGSGPLGSAPWWIASQVFLLGVALAVPLLMAAATLELSFAVLARVTGRAWDGFHRGVAGELLGWFVLWGATLGGSQLITRWLADALARL